MKIIIIHLTLLTITITIVILVFMLIFIFTVHFSCKFISVEITQPSEGHPNHIVVC